MNAPVTVDVAGGPMGGAARFRQEFYGYLARSGRKDVRVIGAERQVDPSWLLRREISRPSGSRRVALNNVSFVAPGGERWTLLGNALHFLLDGEASSLEPSLRTATQRQATVVRLAAQRSHVLVAPCSAMAERVRRAVPSIGGRVVVRMHPVSANSIPQRHRAAMILCPVIFESYKHMVPRIAELLAATETYREPSVRISVTAYPAEVPDSLSCHPRINLVGRLPHADLCRLWARSQAIYFPSGLESFGYPLAEARASGHPIIARDTAQNREIAGTALCGFTPGNAASLQSATELALTTEIAPDPEPFDPDAYFNWMLGPHR
jgi:Glycosyl transferases group 1